MTNDSAATPDFAMSTPALITALADQLGFKMIAYLGRVKETRAARQWAQGTCALTNTEDIERFRIAFRATSLIMSRESAQVARAWFQGLNPGLGDVSPARLLRDGDINVVGPQIITAAKKLVNLR